MRTDDDLLWVFLWIGMAIFGLGVYLGWGTAQGKGVEKLELVRVNKDELEVVDGDTIRIGRSSYRLIGFDTPETTLAKCEGERIAGDAAALRLSELIVLSKTVQMDYRGKDKYKRTLAVMYIDGIDVASILIKEGHAVSYNGRIKRRSWCEGDTGQKN